MVEDIDEIQTKFLTDLFEEFIDNPDIQDKGIKAKTKQVLAMLKDEEQETNGKKQESLFGKFLGLK